MNAIAPLNLAAVRVSANDNSNVVSQLKGRTAVFEQMPYNQPNSASTGDKIFQPLDENFSPPNPLGIGIHLHWELPDVFRRGQQPAEGGQVVFPAAPNRWLVVRYLSRYDAATQAYGAVSSKAWVVESDYLSPTLTVDPDGVTRPAVAVPITPANSKQPFMYMGRVLDYDTWQPNGTPASSYLPAYTGTNGKPLFLTAVGFVGPSFAGYYPECSSVFGFWDHFKDVPDLYAAITNNQPVQFRATYQVIGWLADETTDPLTSFDAGTRRQYDQLWQQWQAQNIAPTQTPAEVAVAYACQQYRWTLQAASIPYTLNADYTIATLELPTHTLCAGQLQEVVWNMLQNPGSSYFLANPTPGQQPAVWTDEVEVAVGNTTTEALSALLKHDVQNPADSPEELDDYEYLLNAFQLGLLADLESGISTIFDLDEALHSRGFARQAGGQTWLVTQRGQTASGQAPPPATEVTLPLPLAEQLYLLNKAQKDYDQGRAQLDVQRRQLFMDWLRYVKLFVGETTAVGVTAVSVAAFLTNSSGGELEAVISAGQAIGRLHYQRDASGQVTGLQQPATATSRAYAVWQQFNVVAAALAQDPKWEIQCAPAAPFWQPTDPVLLLEGKRMEPVRRNGSTDQTPVRVSSELLGSLGITYLGASTTLAASALSGLPSVNPTQPLAPDVATLFGEAGLLVPMLAGGVATALQANPGPVEVPSYALFAESLQAAQGGLSPLEASTSAGLYAAVRAADYQPAPNPGAASTTPLAVAFTFTNATSTGWAPSAIAWNAQQAYPEFTATRYDPFMPVFLVWRAQLDPLRRNDDTQNNYSASNLTDYFSLDADAIDYVYALEGNKPAGFTLDYQVPYSGTVVLSKKPTYNLADQIDKYVQAYPQNPPADSLRQLAAAYRQRRLLSQAIGGFDAAQILQLPLPKVAVQDLGQAGRDKVTRQVNQAALTANPDDNWYDFGFNGQSPLATGLPAIHNFGPLRSGFAGFTGLEIVDVFGQRMQLGTAALNPDGTLQVVPALALRPAAGDTTDAERVYLPPRLLAPTRLWFRWLSARFDPAVSGVVSDFVEMGTQPATSPIFGWVLPNHLDNNLFFYNDNGQAIGSFGVEHGKLKYRTRAGNLSNPNDDLALDIGPVGQPKEGINPHIATFLWSVDKRDAGFLTDLLGTIEVADASIAAPDYVQDAGLAVLIGRPLALARTVLALETAGYVLPVSQADTANDSPFPADVNAARYDYLERQRYSAAALDAVRLPVRLGDLAKTNDGLVAFLPEAAGATPYGTVYSPAAPAAGANGVVRPTATTVQLTLNAPTQVFTLLLDPRAAVHATTGLLPVEQLRLAPDQYSQIMRQLAVTFVTHPVLQRRDRLVLPLPAEAGYDWDWVQLLGQEVLSQPLVAQAGNGFTSYGYSPQNLLEGWLRLRAAPPLATKPEPAP